MYELEYKETCLFQVKNLLYETDVQLNFKKLHKA